MRADSEHRIKELKLGIVADRLSCSSFTAIELHLAADVQFRLLLAQAADILLLAICQVVEKTQFATAQVERLRSMLMKGAARVQVSVRRVLVELSLSELTTQIVILSKLNKRIRGSPETMKWNFQ